MLEKGFEECVGVFYRMWEARKRQFRLKGPGQEPKSGGLCSVPGTLGGACNKLHIKGLRRAPDVHVF
jgi:hypothetical protein